MRLVPAKVPAPVLFMCSALSQYVGAGLAVGLFAVMSLLGVTWFRLAGAAVVLLAWRRSWRRGTFRVESGSRAQDRTVEPGSSDVVDRGASRLSSTVRAWLWSVVFGVAMASMNLLFYQAISRIPLGVAVFGFAGAVVGRIVFGL